MSRLNPCKYSYSICLVHTGLQRVSGLFIKWEYANTIVHICLALGVNLLNHFWNTPKRMQFFFETENLKCVTYKQLPLKIALEIGSNHILHILQRPVNYSKEIPCGYAIFSVCIIPFCAVLFGPINMHNFGTPCTGWWVIWKKTSQNLKMEI